MKRLIALVLVLCMSFSMVACSSEDASNEKAVGTGETEFEKEVLEPEGEIEIPSFKIAFGYGNYEDKLGQQFTNCMKYLADAFGCEIILYESGRGEEAVSNLETILTKGDIDGVIMVGGVDAARMEVASKYNVPVIAACTFLSSATELDAVTAYDNFLGGVVDNDIWAGVRCIEALYNAGSRNICYSGLMAGISQACDERAAGVGTVAAKYDDLNVLAESFTIMDYAGDIATFNASFPEMDGIGYAAMSDSIFTALEAEGLADGSVKVAGIDITSQTGTYLEKGVQVWACGGQYASAMVGFAVLYSYLADGTRIIKNNREPINRKYIEVNSYEEFEKYTKYIEASIPVYTAQEIKDMIPYFTPGVTIDDYIKDADVYSLDDVIARHGDIIR